MSCRGDPKFTIVSASAFCRLTVFFGCESSDNPSIPVASVSQKPEPAYYSPTARLVTVLLLLFGFLIGVKTLGEGFKLLGGDAIDVIFSATSNPFMGLVVGILATTIVQSSSVTTAMEIGRAHV